MGVDKAGQVSIKLGKHSKAQHLVLLRESLKSQRALQFSLEELGAAQRFHRRPPRGVFLSMCVCAGPCSHRRIILQTTRPSQAGKHVVVPSSRREGSIVGLVLWC